MKTIWTNTIQPVLCNNIIQEKEQLTKTYLSKEEDMQEKIKELELESAKYLKAYSDSSKDVGVLNKELKAKDKTLLDVQLKLSEYTKKDKHLTLPTFMDWLKVNVKPVSKMHKLNADLGTMALRNTNIRPSNFLKRCITEEDKPIVLKFAEDVLYFKSFTNEDDLVYKFNVRFDTKFPTNKYYRYDKVAYGFDEYWATPIQTINLIKNKGYYSDCDDVSHLKYWCLRLLLDQYFPNWDKNRLRPFLAWVMGYEYHALLSWVKEGPNDWIPVETTYFNQRFPDVWVGNMTLRSNTIAYEVSFSYDTESEYEKI